MKKIVIAAAMVVLCQSWLTAQSTGTIGGTAADGSGAILPGATVTAVNVDTKVPREAVTNSAGLYSLAGLSPGTYDVTASLSGFAETTRRVQLLADTTISVDFTLGLGALTERIEVSSGALLVQTTKSEVGSSVQTSEVQNLPMLNRNFVGLVALVPGARTAPAVNSNKTGFGGGIAVGGATGRYVQTNVDGLENRDDIVGGPLFNFTIEGIEEFRVLNHQFGVQYGRTNGSVVQVVSKSGGNVFHGTLFGYGRNDTMTAIDYFSEQGGLGDPPYSRAQFGGSLGGPVIPGKFFFFGALERTRENRSLVFPTNMFTQVTTLKQALLRLTDCPTCLQVGNAIVPSPDSPQTIRDLMYTVKADYNINNRHALFARYAAQRLNNFNDILGANHPDLDPTGSNVKNIGTGYSFAMSETWVIGSDTVNTFGVQANRIQTVQSCECGTPGPYWAFRNLNFPSIQVGANTSAAFQDFHQEKIQFKDDYSRQLGKHAIKFGGDFGIYPLAGLSLGGAGANSQGTMSFFDDPSVIVSNAAKYPQGFLTPGAVSSVTVGTIMLGGPPGVADSLGMKQLGLYFQDDWRLKSNVTLNLGLRYDLDINWYNQREYANNRTYKVLKAIGSPYATLPKTPVKDLAPRAGIAWDVTGDGKNVMRGGFGVFFDQYLIVSSQSIVNQEKATTNNLASTFTNSAVGTGQLPTFVYGLSTLPLGPAPGLTELRPGANTSGAWFDKMSDPYNLQFHLGYTRQVSPTTIVSIDASHILGRNEGRQRMINPVEGAWDPNAASYNTCGAPAGYRRLRCAFQTVLGDPAILGAITLWSYTNKSQYDDLLVHLEQRAERVTFQASYTLARAKSWGGGFGGSSGGTGISNSQNVDLPFGPGEWGPSVADARHRLVLSGVFALPFGIQASPIFQVESGRPYNLTAGRDCNGDGMANDRAFLDAAGNPAACNAAGATQASVNSARGQATYNIDTRVTKFFNFAGSRKLGVFAELYNLTNRANFGNAYNGNASSATFRQPTGFLAGGLALPTSRQLQVGARFSF